MDGRHLGYIAKSLKKTLSLTTHLSCPLVLTCLVLEAPIQCFFFLVKIYHFLIKKLRFYFEFFEFKIRLILLFLGQILPKFWYPKKEKLNVPILHSHFLTTHHTCTVSLDFFLFLITFFSSFLPWNPCKSQVFKLPKKKEQMWGFKRPLAF